MRKTTILQPLPTDEFTRKQIGTYRKNFRHIEEHLNKVEIIECLTLEQFFDQLHISEEEYILSERSSLKSPTVFLKRTLKETRKNNYSYHILLAWRAKIDLQFVLDVYACATYVASSDTKSQRGKSDLLCQASQEASDKNVEISAQEAAYICLQLPMKHSSRKVIFVKTSPPEERITLLKPQNQLEKNGR